MAHKKAYSLPQLGRLYSNATRKVASKVSEDTVKKVKKTKTDKSR